MKTFRLAALVLLLAVLLCLPVSASSGRQVTDSGVWENIRWTLYDDGELYISGNGAIPCVTYQWEVPWAEYKTSILSVTMAGNITELGFYGFYGCTNLKSVVIPNSVTRILSDAFNGCASLENVTIPEGTTTLGSRAFYGCTSLMSVTIPEGVTSIGYRAFDGCTGLTSVTIPGSVTSIGDGAFSGCTSLMSVTIPEGVTEIGYSAFSDCSSLTSVTIPGGVTSIGGEAFFGCTGLMSVTIPEGVTSIGGGAFFGCTSLTSVTIPEGVTSIGDSAFYNCTSLSSVAIPEGVTSIGFRAFGNCTGLTSVTISEGVTSIGESAFAYCTSLTSVTIPTSVDEIGGSAFSGCTSLTSVTIPEGVTSIGDSAFYNCTSLTSVTIPEGVTSIGDWAFWGCKRLTSVTIPGSVTSIGDGAFYGCTSLTSAEFLGNAPELGGSLVFGRVDDNFIIYYHEGATGWTTPTWNGYRTACIDTPGEYSALDADNRNSQHIQFALNETSHTATVVGGYNGSGGGNVVIPDTVTKGSVSYKVIGIGSEAFQNNVYVKSVELGANISSISAAPFYGCVNLAEFSLSAGNDKYSVENGILYDYMKYNLYIYPAGKTAEEFRVPDSVKTISAGAFAYAKNLKTVEITSNVTSIGKEAFKGCTGIENLTLPFIGGSANDSNNFDYIFRNVWGEEYSLKTVAISGESLRGGDFDCSTNLVGSIESIALPSCGDSVPGSSFRDCESLSELVFTDIGAVMENGVLNIPCKVTSIGYMAFGNCKSILEVNIPAAAADISDSAFYGCDGLRSFTVAADNPNYSSDKWGVLFSKDGSTLIQYPASRVWPYYNVPDGVRSISSYAFCNCQNLVNLYIPETVNELDYSCVYGCPSTTLCVKLDSDAASYATSNNHRVWYIDNYTLQGIEVYALPEKTEFEVGEVDFTGLYLTANYGGTRLQLDDYSLSFGSGQGGTQTVNVTAGGKTTSFSIKINGVDESQLLEFNGIPELADGEVGFAALYDSDGRMLGVYEAHGIDGAVWIAAPSNLQWSEARLYVLNGTTWAPAGVYTNVNRA